MLYFNDQNQSVLKVLQCKYKPKYDIQQLLARISQLTRLNANDVFVIFELLKTPGAHRTVPGFLGVLLRLNLVLAILAHPLCLQMGFSHQGLLRPQ